MPTDVIVKLSLISDNHAKEINAIQIQTQDDSFTTRVDIDTHVLSLLCGQESAYYSATLLDDNKFIIHLPRVQGLSW